MVEFDPDPRLQHLIPGIQDKSSTRPGVSLAGHLVLVDVGMISVWAGLQRAAGRGRTVLF